MLITLTKGKKNNLNFYLDYFIQRAVRVHMLKFCFLEVWKCLHKYNWCDTWIINQQSDFLCGFLKLNVVHLCLKATPFVSPQNLPDHLSLFNHSAFLHSCAGCCFSSHILFLHDFLHSENESTHPEEGKNIIYRLPNPLSHFCLLDISTKMYP